MQSESAPDSEPVASVARGSICVRVLVGLWVAGLLLALYPYTGNPASPIKHLISGWAAVVIALAAGMAAWRDRRLAPALSPALGLAALWITISGVAALRNGLSPLMLGPALDTLAPLVVFWCIAYLAVPQLRDARAAKRMASVVVIAVTLSSLYGFAQALGLDPFPWASTSIEEYRGLPSTYGNPNFAGHVLVLALPLAAALAWQRLPWALLPLGLMATHLYLTGMRGGMAGLGAGVVLLMAAACLRKRALPPMRRVLGTLVLTALLLGVLGGGLLAAHRARTGDWLPVDGSLVLRYQGYDGAARMVLERPVLGWGPGRYAVENPRYWTPYEQSWFAAEGRLNDHVHNEPLEAAVDAGLLGLSLYAALLAYAVIAALHLAFTTADPLRRRLAYGLAVAFIAFAVDGLFGFNLRVPASAGLLFLLLALLDALGAAPPRATRWAHVTSFSMAGLSLACALVLTASFQAERCLQRSRGALGWAEQMEGQVTEASIREALEEGRQAAAAAAALRPWDARMHLAHAEALGRLGETDAAASAAAWAATCEPNSPARRTAYAQRLLGVATESGPTPETALAAAQAEAEVAVGLCPGYPPAEEVLGRVALALAGIAPAEAAGRAARFEAARAHLSTALRGNVPRRADLQVLLSRACLGANDPAAAIAALRRALELAPDRMDAWDQLERLAARQRDWTPYRETLSRQLRRATAEPLVRSLRQRLAAVYAASPGDRALGHGLYATLLAQDPARLDYWGGFLGSVPADALPAVLRDRVDTLGMAEHDAAPALILAARAALDGDAPAWDTLATQSADAAHVMPPGDPDAARTMLAWLCPLLAQAAQNDALPRETRGRLQASHAAILVAMQDWPAAAALFEADFSALPRRDRPEWLADHATTLAALGRPEEAMPLAREAQRTGATRVYPRLAVARLLVAQGAREEARFLYNAVLSDLVDGAVAAQVRAELAALEAAGGGAP